MSTTKLIRKANLEKFFNKIQSNATIIAPVKKADKIEFETTTDFNSVQLDYIQTTQSIKSAVFPRFEKVINYTLKGKEFVYDDSYTESFPSLILFGLHPCDASGFRVLDAVFTTDIKDKFLNGRLSKLTIIGLSCSQSDEYCFCTSVGLNPGDTTGSDILLSKLKSGDFLAEIITDKGNDVFNSAKEFFEDSDISIKNENITDVPVAFSSADIFNKLAGVFENPIWEKQALRCIGCGACAFVCPVCSCFDIQDEGTSNKGYRLRCWDSCGFSQFTIHTSGHNPREVQPHRWRQRILHKFSYQPETIKMTGCVGCGRCSRACPVDMDIKEHLIDINSSL